MAIMGDSDFEIEYLEEDEEVVQQCIDTFQAVPSPDTITIKPPKVFGGTPRYISPKSLLVERICLQNDRNSKRKPPQKIKTATPRQDDSDSDYDPSQDNSDDEPILDELERPRKQIKNRKMNLNSSIISNQLKKERVHKATQLEENLTINKDIGPMSLKNSNFIAKYQEFLKDKKSSFVPSKRSRITVKSSEITPNRTETIISIEEKPKSPAVLDKPLRTYSKSVNTEHFTIFPPNPEDIRLFDYSNPKCITGAKLLADNQTLNNWNDICRKQSEKYEKMDKKVKTSRTTQFLKNITVKKEGKLETVLKLHIEMRDDNNIDIFQAVLPKFRMDTPKIEIKYRQPRKGVNRNNTTVTQSVTLLCTETSKEGRVLVAYSPSDCRSTTFKMVEAGESDGKYEGRHIRMLMSCKMCTRCYQYSWRGNKDTRAKTEAKCKACSSEFTSAYNLLSHIRSHDDPIVHRCKREQAKILSKIVGYHYKCRICDFEAQSIKSLRSHLNTHSGPHKFKCEVGQHVTT